jgi:hypothetical protein
LGGLDHQYNGNICKAAFDLVIKDEDAITARGKNALQLATQAEQEKANKYSAFERFNKHKCIGICITTRGTFGPNMGELMGFLKQSAKLNRVKINISQFKKELMCIIRKADSGMRSFFKS